MVIKIHEASGSIGTYYGLNLLSMDADKNLNFRITLSSQYGEIETEIIMTKLELLDLFDHLTGALYEEN
jgi:hypothetical protein